MGSVWEAQGDSDGETAALKILHPSLAVAPVERLRLVRKAKAKQISALLPNVPAREIGNQPRRSLLKM